MDGFFYTNTEVKRLGDLIDAISTFVDDDAIEEQATRIADANRILMLGRPIKYHDNNSLGD